MSNNFEYFENNSDLSYQTDPGNFFNDDVDPNNQTDEGEFFDDNVSDFDLNFFEANDHINPDENVDQNDQNNILTNSENFDDEPKLEEIDNENFASNGDNENSFF